MKKISKSRWDIITTSMNQCQEASETVESLVERFNEVLEQWREQFSEAVEHYNEVLGDFRTIWSDLAAEGRDYQVDRSEKWQESEAGEAYEQWLTDMDSIEAEDIEIDFPDPLEQPDFPDWQDTEWLPPTTPGDR